MRRLGRIRGLHTPRARLELRSIKDNLDAITQNCKARKVLSREHVEKIGERYTAFTAATTKLNGLLARRGQLSKAIQKADENEKEELLREASDLKPIVQSAEAEKNGLEEEVSLLASVLPNTSHPNSPVGDESKIKIIEYINEENQYTSDEPIDHVEIARRLDLIDFDTAAKTSGTGFYYLKNEAVTLELALTAYALEKARSAGFQMMRCPDLVRSEFVSACGFQPRDAHGQQIYQTMEGLSLVGTAEIPLAALGTNKIYLEKELPQRYVAVGRAFRAEAGARGADTRGLYRVHEFTKIEMFTFCKPADSEQELEKIVRIQKSIVKDLGLCARILEMPTEELGASAHRKFDIEAWIPSRGEWGEITSASNCTDYQARRLNIRYKDGGRNPFVHTLNGTAIAIPRLMVAGFETWFSHARIKVPECLHRYMEKDIGVRSD